ncbi:MAG: radical SAM protein HxsC4, partial [Myxococcota bacterium]|nr:radical SAM protein HxsC4 [Myxococcota bacterium]
MTQRGPTVEERIASRRERVHVLTGAVCNNNCIFCMEEDREGRYVTNSATTDEVVRWILRSSQGAEEICFTSGEPTTNPRLPQWVRWAREAGYPRVSVMTNGRACSYERYTRMLVAAGMNRFYVSIHGHEARLHEGLTRTPGSFEQTVEGIRQIARYVPRGIELHTSTVVTRRNLPFMGDIYRFLRSLGVQQVVFNVMQANGRAHTYFEKIFPRYSEIARTARDFLEAQGRLEQPVQAFLVDIPLCTTTELPDYNRGYVEAYVHYEPPVGAHDVPLRRQRPRRRPRRDPPLGPGPRGADEAGGMLPLSLRPGLRGRLGQLPSPLRLGRNAARAALNRPAGCAETEFETETQSESETEPETESVSPP